MKCQRDKFRIGRKDTYLNCAYMSPLLKKVENAGKKGIALKRKPNKISESDFFHDTETLRSLFAELINCDQPNRLVLIPSVSYGMANVIKNLTIKKGQNIVVAGDQFPSNIYPWVRACEDVGAALNIIAAPDTIEERGTKWNDLLLSAINDNTRAVALSHIHWADGTLFDLEAIREATNKVGALLIIDGTQSIGALPFDIQKIQPDALVCAAYKWLLGPYSIGIAYYGQAFDKGVPVEESWMNRINSDDFSNLVNYENSYRDGGLRYEVGEHSNFILTPMFLESIKQIRKWGPDNIQAYCKKLISESVKELRGLGLFIENDNQRSSHLFGIKCPEDKIALIKNSFKKNRVNVSFRGNFIRVSPHVYNDLRDMNRLLYSFKQVF